MHSLLTRLGVLFVAAIVASLGLTAAVGVTGASAASWTGYEQLGTPQIKAVAATSPGYVGGVGQPPSRGQLNVFVIGTDNALWHKRFVNGAWSSYQQLGTEPIKAVAATSSSPTQLDVFVIGTDNSLLHKRYVDGAWGGYELLSMLPIKAVAATSSSLGRLDVFAIRNDNSTLLHKRYYNGAWSDYDPLGTEQMKAVAASSPGTGRIDVSVIGTQDTLWHKRRGYDGIWSGFQGLGSERIQAVANAQMKCGGAHTFVIGTDYPISPWFALGALWHKSEGTGGWSGYEQLGTSPIIGVAATSPSPGRLDAFVVGTDSALWHKSGTYPYFVEGPC